MIEVFQRLNRLEPAAMGAEELTPEEVPFLRFDAEAQELFDRWRATLEQKLRAEEDHPVLLSHFAKYRSLMPSLALIGHLIDSVDASRGGPIVRAAVQRAAGWCEYLEGHARRLYATVTDPARVAAALLATKIARGRLASPFTAREVYRSEWTGLTEPRVVQRALECLEELGWIRPEAIRARGGGRPMGALSRQPLAASQGVSDALGAGVTSVPNSTFCQFCRARQGRFCHSEWPDDPGVAAANRGCTTAVAEATTDHNYP